jgi:hypothetical protein
VSKTSLLPSLSGWQLERAVPAFWGVLESVEKLRVAAYLVLPTLSRFVLLGGFAATMKGFVAVSREGATSSVVWIHGLVMFVLLSLAAVLQFAQQRTFLGLNRDLRRAVRRVVGRELLKVGVVSRQAGVRPKYNIAVEKELSKGVGPGLVAAVELASGLLFVALILAAITVFLPIAGALMALIGIVLLLVFRLKVRGAKAPAPSETREAPAERARMVKEMLEGKSDEDALLVYEFNPADVDLEDKKYRQRFNETRVSAISAAISAVVVTICFLLVAFTGLRSHDPIHLILFVIAVRLFATQGKLLLKQWTEILRRRKTLFAFTMVLSGRDGFAKLREVGGGRAATRKEEPGDGTEGE